MNKNIQNMVENWKALAEYDFDAAGIMLKNGKYMYVCFMCQQCIEKILKGVYVSKIRKTPPYTHNLQRLLSDLSILEMLSYYYMESRYTEQIQEVAQIITEEKAANIYVSTKALFECLKNKI
jgi:HEPN domain-containing protein